MSAGLAVVGAIVGEFIAGGGLGSVVDIARTQQRIDKVFAAVLLASLLGLGLFGLINLLSYLMLRRWHASEQVGVIGYATIIECFPTRCFEEHS